MVSTFGRTKRWGDRRTDVSVIRLGLTSVNDCGVSRTQGSLIYMFGRTKLWGDRRTNVNVIRLALFGPLLWNIREHR
jgi:hypothetical protein